MGMEMSKGIWSTIACNIALRASAKENIEQRNKVPLCAATRLFFEQ